MKLIQYAIFIFTLFSTYSSISQTIKPSSVKLNKDFAFIENKGQIVDQTGKINNEVLYLFNYPGLNIQLRKDGFSYDSYTEEQQEIPDQFHDSLFTLLRRPKEVKTTRQYHRVDVKLVSINSNTEIVVFGQSQDYTNYYTVIGKPEGVLLVHSYQRVLYKNIYPGIDLEFKISDNKENVPFEYNFIVHSGADLSKIQMECSGAPVSVSEDGTQITLFLQQGNLQEEIPASWYEVPGKKETALVQYYLKNKNTLGLKLSANAIQKKNRKLIIDPIPSLLWATYYGGGNVDYVNAIVLDSLKNIYATGVTKSTSNIATSGAYQTTYSGTDGSFIAKMNNTGVRIWATYCCGSGFLRSYGLSIDRNGNLYISGETNSTVNIATTGAYQIARNGISDGFLMKFSSYGSKMWGTYIGGNAEEYARGNLTYSNGFIVLLGVTYSTGGLSTTGAFQQAFGGNQDGFLAKIDTTGSVLWITYYGGTGQDEISSAASDIYGNYYICGSTTSTSAISTPGSFQSTYFDIMDGFICKFSPSGNRIWASYYGGNNGDGFSGVQCDSGGFVYFVGSTMSFFNIASVNAHQSAFGGGTLNDGMIVKFDSVGHRIWASYYGGSQHDQIGSVSLINDTTIIVYGNSESNNNISTPSTFQPIYSGSQDCFLACFDSTGTRKWGTYYGGNNNDISWLENSCSVDNSGGIYICGATYSSSGLTTSSSHQPNYAGNMDGFIAKFSNSDCSGLSASITNQNNISCNGEKDGSATVTPSGGFPPYTFNWTPSGCTDSIATNLMPGNYSVIISDNGGCQTGVNVTITEPTPILCYSLDSLPDNGSCNGTASIGVWGGTSPYSYYWQPNGATGNYLFSLCTGMYYVTVTDAHGCTYTEDVFVPSTLSINNSQEDDGLSVFPNPASDFISISGKNMNQSQPLSFKITDITGRTVLYKKFNLENNTNIPVLVNHLAEGSYFYEITGKELRQHGKIIIAEK